MHNRELTHPFESAIEEQLADALDKYVAETTGFENQVEVKTPNGAFRLDFLLTSHNRKVAIEADGREFHNYSRDMFRDALILAHTDVDAVYRLRGRDIHRMLEDALYSISVVEPWIFSQRALVNLRMLSTVSRSDERLRIISEFIIAENEEVGLAWIRQLSKTMENPIWRRLADFANSYPGASIEELVRAADQEGLRWYGDAWRCRTGA